MKRMVVALLLSAWAAAGWSAGAGLDLLTARIDVEDTASLQRGARIYVNYCLGCHSLSFMRYDRIGRDLGIGDEQVKENLLFAADKVTDPMTIAMRPEAAAKWFGVAPPDLSVTARAHGPDWLYSYLVTFYADPGPLAALRREQRRVRRRRHAARPRPAAGPAGIRPGRRSGGGRERCTPSASPWTATTSSFARARRCPTGATRR